MTGAVAAIWERFLSDDNRRMLERRPVRRRIGLGRRPALVVINVHDAVLGEDRSYADQADRASWSLGDDAVGVAPQASAGDVGDAAELDRYVDLSGTGLRRPPRVRAECFDTDRHRTQRRDVAHHTVDHETRPAILRRHRRRAIAHQRRPERSAAIDHQHLTVAALGEDSLDQHGVLMTAHRADRPGEPGHAADVDERQLAALQRVASVVEEVGGRPLLRVQSFDPFENMRACRASPIVLRARTVVNRHSDGMITGQGLVCISP